MMEGEVRTAPMTLPHATTVIDHWSSWLAEQNFPSEIIIISFMVAVWGMIAFFVIMDNHR